MRKWTHKVVKTQRGNRGEWFRYPAAATFSELAEADEYARRFVEEQHAVAGTRILVVQRKGNLTVADYATQR
jgi:hypothetical protein